MKEGSGDKRLEEFVIDTNPSSQSNLTQGSRNKSHRLNDWEAKFCANIRSGYLLCYLGTWDDMSEKQKVVAEKIERKIHDVG